MKVSTPGLAHPGIDEFFNPGSGAQEYPQQGGTPSKHVAALNHESQDSFWVFVPWNTANLATVLRTHVGTDIAIKLPVMARVDAHFLPNWTGEGEWLIQHAITIVGYNDTNGTYTYLDSCGTACNSRTGNYNGGVYTIPQSQLVTAIHDGLGDGFIW